MRKTEDLTGKTFGKLTVISRTEDSVSRGGTRRTQWLCSCSCGNLKVVKAVNILCGKSTSCGCLKKESSCSNRLVHGGAINHRATRTYDAWKNMKSRCQNPNNTSYSNYGNRGITVCASWQAFKNFLADMGECPSDNHSIDRIDNNGNYEPGNCRWATKLQQASNTRTNVYVTFYGRTMTASEWARELNVNHETVSQRIRRGWSAEDAITRPLRGRKGSHLVAIQ